MRFGQGARCLRCGFDGSRGNRDVHESFCMQVVWSEGCGTRLILFASHALMSQAQWQLILITRAINGRGKRLMLSKSVALMSLLVVGIGGSGC